MTTITCLKELNKRKCLEFDDTVVFTTNEEKISYKVGDNYLRKDPIKLSNNEEIFIILKLKKYKIATKAYGYKVISADSDWPTSEHDDYPALTRLVRELYTIIEKKRN